MLGEKLAEASGKITGIRVLSANQVEVTFQGSSRLLGLEATEIGTYCQTVRADGMLYGEGQVVFMTKDGDMAAWKGIGVGRPTGPGFSASYAVCGSFETASPKLARLLSVAIVIEYDVAENGDYSYQSWEWKRKAGSG